MLKFISNFTVLKLSLVVILTAISLSACNTVANLAKSPNSNSGGASSNNQFRATNVGTNETLPVSAKPAAINSNLNRFSQGVYQIIVSQTIDGVKASPYTLKIIIR